MTTYLLTQLVWTVFGLGWPAYRSFKAIQAKDFKRLTRLLVYWIVIATFLVIEPILDVFSWFPFYAQLKLVLILFLLVPEGRGAIYVYKQYLLPFLMENEQKIDDTVVDLQTNFRSTVVEIGKQATVQIQNFLIEAFYKSQVIFFHQMAKPSQPFQTLTEAEKIEREQKMQRINEILDDIDPPPNKPIESKQNPPSPSTSPVSSRSNSKDNETNPASQRSLSIPEPELQEKGVGPQKIQGEPRLPEKAKEKRFDPRVNSTPAPIWRENSDGFQTQRALSQQSILQQTPSPQPQQSQPQQLNKLQGKEALEEMYQSWVWDIDNFDQPDVTQQGNQNNVGGVYPFNLIFSPETFYYSQPKPQQPLNQNVPSPASTPTPLSSSSSSSTNVNPPLKVSGLDPNMSQGKASVVEGKNPKKKAESGGFSLSWFW